MHQNNNSAVVVYDNIRDIFESKVVVNGKEIIIIISHEFFTQNTDLLNELKGVEDTKTKCDLFVSLLLEQIKELSIKEEVYEITIDSSTNIDFLLNNLKK